jgi:hypothetical protein
MAKPSKRKGSNKFQFRRATPNDIWVKRKQLAALGLVVKREVTQTLGTVIVLSVESYNQLTYCI